MGKSHPYATRSRTEPQNDTMPRVRQSEKGHVPHSLLHTGAAQAPFAHPGGQMCLEIGSSKGFSPRLSLNIAHQCHKPHEQEISITTPFHLIQAAWMGEHHDFKLHSCKI